MQKRGVPLHSGVTIVLIYPFLSAFRVGFFTPSEVSDSSLLMYIVERSMS